MERAFDIGELPDDLKPAAPPSPSQAEFVTLADILTSYLDEATPLQKSGDLPAMKIDLWLAEPFVNTKRADLKAALST
ncbi:hypothetical protein AWV79_06070 [Cupriavidus sp. UYMMa02A]|nr:hypothetical protein AWV79_06070 [Cupriavidus sp. UYMMa02A]